MLNDESIFKIIGDWYSEKAAPIPEKREYCVCPVCNHVWWPDEPEEHGRACWIPKLRKRRVIIVATNHQRLLSILGDVADYIDLASIDEIPDPREGSLEALAARIREVLHVRNGEQP